MEQFDREWIMFGPATGYSVEDTDEEGLYLLYCDDPRSVKVGISRRPLVRATNLSTGSPNQLHLFFYSRLLGKSAEENLHAVLASHRRSGEWFNWTPELQGFLLGVVFALSGVLQVSWPFSASCDGSQFIRGVDWLHRFLDPDDRWTLRPMTGMGGEAAFKLFKSWNDAGLEQLRAERAKRNLRKPDHLPPLDS